MAAPQQQGPGRAPGGPPPGSGAPAIIYHQPVCSGTLPVGRWAHAAAAAGPFLYVYGGVGPAVLDDLAVLDVELMVWRSLTPSAPRPRDRPDKLHAAAMCALGGTLWLFGGQQGRKHQRNLYSLSTEQLAWRLVTPEGGAPAAREGHTLTAVAPSVGALLFGGQGKRLYADLHLLKPGGSEWVELKPAGRPPPPRSGHSMTWDGGDRLLCFGGATASASDSSLYVYSISRNAWAAQEARGTPPSPRTRHTAVLLSPTSLLVFGGCNSGGVFFNDAYLLNLDTWVWARAQPLNPPPPPRYHHSCHVVGGKVVLYGGVNPKQAFDAVVLLQTSSGCQELSAMADELARMTGGSAARSSATAPAAAAAGAAAVAAAAVPAAATAAGGSSAASSLLAPAAAAAAAAGSDGGDALPAVVGDLMKLQLRDLLVKRNMEELTITAQHKAEAVEAQLKRESAEKVALAKEVMQLKLIKEEAEAAVKGLKEQLADSSRALTRETAEHQATSAVLSDLRSSLESREQQLAEARQLLDSMSAELGILASRLHRLQQERDALRAARQQQEWRSLARREQLTGQQQQQSPLAQSSVASSLQDASQRQQLTGAAAAAAQMQQEQLLDAPASMAAAAVAAAAARSGAAASYAGDNDAASTVDSQSFVDCFGTSVEAAAAAQQALEQYAAQPEALASALRRLGSASRRSSPLGPDSDSLLPPPSGLLDPPGTDEPLPLCTHGQLGAACLLCMCQRFLEATAGSCSHLQTGSSLAAAAARLSGSSSNAPHLAAGAADAGAANSSSDPAAAAAGSSGAGPSAAGLATAAVAACASEAAQYRQYLSISELARNRLEAENAALQQQVAALQGQAAHQARELRVLQAHPGALTACSIDELTALEGSLEASTKAVRQVVLQRSIAEYQAQASADTLRCAVCMEARRSLAFGCGHQTCDKCGDQITSCPFCRQSITAKIRLFE